MKLTVLLLLAFIPCIFSQDCLIPLGAVLGYDLQSDYYEISKESYCSDVISITCCTSKALSELGDNVQNNIGYFVDASNSIADSMTQIFYQYSLMLQDVTTDIDLKNFYDPDNFTFYNLSKTIAEIQQKCFIPHFLHEAAVYCYGCDANYSHYQIYQKNSDKVILEIDELACTNITESCLEYNTIISLAANISIVMDDYYSTEEPDEYEILTEDQISALKTNLFDDCGWVTATGIDLDMALARQKIFVEYADNLKTSEIRKLSTIFSENFPNTSSSFDLYAYATNDSSLYPNSVKDGEKSGMLVSVPLVYENGYINIISLLGKLKTNIFKWYYIQKGKNVKDFSKLSLYKGYSFGNNMII